MLKSLLLVTITSVSLNIVLSAQIGNCGPVDYFHLKVLDKDLHLDSWHIDSNGSFEYILELSAGWWKLTPDINGWPAWCTASVLDRKYNQYNGSIPGTVCSDAIISCLKYYIYTGDTAYLKIAKKAGDFIIYQDLTPSNYKCYPGFPYAVGYTGNINPNGSGHPDSISTFNLQGHIQPDKGAMAGIALLELYKVTDNRKYLTTAVNIANCLSENVKQGTTLNSPWPMRVMADNGNIVDGVFSANVSYACRLFDELLRIGQIGNGLYKSTRDSVWHWLKTDVISYNDASKWKNFFEDHSGDEDNPLQIDAIETARYLLEARYNADIEWFNLSGKIIEQVTKRWALSKLEVDGYVCIAEQDMDKSPYNSHTSRYGSVLAMYYAAGGNLKYKDIAYHSLCFGLYSIEDDGFTSTYFKPDRGAWTSDSFGDFLGHYMDAFAAIPEWAGNGNHMLKSSSTIKSITYKGTDMITYTAYDNSGIDRLKVRARPDAVLVNGVPVFTYSWDNINKVLVVNRLSGSDVLIELPEYTYDPPNILDEDSFTVFPNPVRDILTLKLPETYENSILIVSSINRGIVLRESFDKTNPGIKMGSYNSGIYIITISNGVGTLSRKVIKE